MSRGGEVPVYEGFFESGFRDQVPSLIAELSRAVNISPGQLNPPAWRILIAMQNLGDLEGLVVGVAEALYCYSVSPLNGGERRYHLHPRGRMLPVQELSRSEKKRHPIFEGNWASKFAFMPLPGFSSTWRTADISRPDFSSGRHIIEQLLGPPLDRREISFLVSEEALDRRDIGTLGVRRRWRSIRELSRLRLRGRLRFIGQFLLGAVIFSLPEVVSAKQLLLCLLRLIRRGLEPLFSSLSFMPSRSCSKAVASLNSEVFPMTPTRPSLDEDTSKVVHSLQGDVLQVASQLFHLKGRMKNRSATKAERDALAIRLCEEKDAILAKDEEIEAWKLRVQDLDEERERLEAEDVSLRRRIEDKEEEICKLRYAAEVFDAEKMKAVDDAKVVVRWELMQEWLDDQTDRWDSITSFEQYKVVKISEAEFLGLPPPSFEYKP
ncbi:hypothetical protein F2Q70_00037233 [Brassica cretica]|uniref:Uncharacterized protein n=1 Tax=Brassica cretica TaxID=69181 RepID=A0A8S9JYB2_BRACR|nr:hypothetical protein F2Q70_00037233 [Brassica cretica]